MSTHVNGTDLGASLPAPRTGADAVGGTAVVAGAERLICQSLVTTIERRFTVLDTATTLTEAERALALHQPQLSVLVVDPPFPDVSLPDMCTRLVGRHPMTCALLIFRSRRPQDLVVACRHGARALFDTTITAEQLVHGLERLIGGEVVMQPEILHDLMRVPAEPDGARPGLQPLTPIQTRMLALLAAGHTSKEIATLMNVTTASVNHNLERASQRLGTRHRAEAVARALRLGLIS
ncbi:MAG: response regulator transcription factor [Saccharothrix sp.]|nr:response regulator transcription factor [Saccharothrix sp.]